MIKPKRCEDCAFTPVTDASKSEITVIKATLCAEVIDPFFCHFNAAQVGKETVLPEGKEFICNGWLEKTIELEAEGFYASQPEWKKDLKIELLKVIEDFELKPDATDEEIRLAIMDAHSRMNTKHG